jgi:hypothetical protein
MEAFVNRSYAAGSKVLVVVLSGIFAGSCAAPHSSASVGPVVARHAMLSTTSTSLIASLGWKSDADPEGYYDSQRVVNPAAPSTFGPLVTVFPAPNLGDLKEPDFKSGPVLVALVDLDDDVPGAASSNPLGLKKGSNCLYLQWQGGPNPWKAQVVQPGAGPCAPNNVLIQTAHSSGAAASQYPGVSRIEEAGANGDVLVIGLRCAQHWCDLGAASPVIPGHGHGVGNGLQSSIAGWNDEQRLALYSGGLSVSPFWATIVPEDGIDTRDHAFYADYQTVARVYVYGGTQAQLDATKYGHTGSGKHFGMTVIDDATSTEPNELQLKYDDGTKTWSAQIVDGLGVPHTLKLGLVPHPFGRKLPGTARWLWNDTDDDMWVPCVDGCCTVGDQ